MPEDPPVARQIPPEQRGKKCGSKQGKQGKHDYLRDAGRVPLYIAAFVVLGIACIPFVWVNRRIGKRERIFLCIAGALRSLLGLMVLITILVLLIMLMKSTAQGDANVLPFQ